MVPMKRCSCKHPSFNLTAERQYQREQNNPTENGSPQYILHLSGKLFLQCCVIMYAPAPCQMLEQGCAVDVEHALPGRHCVHLPII